MLLFEINFTGDNTKRETTAILQLGKDRLFKIIKTEV